MASASPAKRALSAGSGKCGAMKISEPSRFARRMSGGLSENGRCGMDFSPSARKSAPVSTAITPGAARARAASIPAMRACACGERTMAAYTWPGRLTSSLKHPLPVSRRESSLRKTGIPIPAFTMGLSPPCSGPREIRKPPDALLPRLVHDPSAHHRHDRLDVLDLHRGHHEIVAVEDHQVRVFARLDRAEVAFLEDEVRIAAGVRDQRLGA